MPLTTEELDSFPEPIVNRDPGDETDHVKEVIVGEEPTLDDVYGLLSKRIEVLEYFLGMHKPQTDITTLFARTDRLAQGLAHLTVTVVEMRDRPSFRRRLRASLKRNKEILERLAR